MAFNIISLEDMYEALNEDRLKSILKEFECELNKDVEFLLEKKQ